MSNNSSSTDNLSNLIQSRNTSLGLNLPSRQAITVPSNLKSEVVIIPSTSAPNFGSYFIFDIKERNCIISDLVLNQLIFMVLLMYMIIYQVVDH